MESGRPGKWLKNSKVTDGVSSPFMIIVIGGKFLADEK